MSVKKRQSYKQKQRQAEERRRRFIIIGGVVAAALIVVAALILLAPKPQTSAAVGDFTTVPTQTYPDTSNDKSMGPKTAKVVVQEYADFQCPYCKEFHDSALPQIIKDYVDTNKIRFEYHHFIVIDQNVGGTESRHAAQASECAADQGQFWNYFNTLFANQQTEGSGTFSDARLKAFAKAIGLNTSKFDSCLNSSAAAQKVAADETKATTYHLQGTPSLLVNDTLVANPIDYTAVKGAIDAALKAAGQ